MRTRAVLDAMARAAMALVMSVVLVRAGAGQEHSVVIGSGAFQAGILKMDLGELNSSLSAAGHPTFADEALPTWGGVGYGAIGKLLVGAEGYGGLDQTVISGLHEISMKGLFGLVRAKYRVLTLGGLDVLPTVGAGAGGISLGIAERSSPSFQDVLNGPERSSTLTTRIMLLFNVGVGVDYRFLIFKTPTGGGGGILLGLEGGYLLAPGGTTWRLNGITSATDGPRVQIEGLYVRATIGGWGR